MIKGFGKGSRNYRFLESNGILQPFVDRFEFEIHHPSSIVRFDPHIIEPWDFFLPLCQQMDGSGFWDEILSQDSLSEATREQGARLHRRIMREDFMPRLRDAANYWLRIRGCVTLVGLFLKRDVDGTEAARLIHELPREVQEFLPEFMIEIRSTNLKIDGEKSPRRKKRDKDQLPLPLMAHRYHVVTRPAYFKLVQVHKIYSPTQMVKLHERIDKNRRDRFGLIRGVENGTIDDPTFLPADVEALIHATRRVPQYRLPWSTNSSSPRPLSI